MKFPCTLCGSRDWPRLDTDCPLCHGEPEEDTRDEYQEWLDNQIIENETP